MKGRHILYSWIRKHFFEVLLILFLSTILTITYSYLPVIIQVAYAKLGNESFDKINLPKFLLNFFSNISSIEMLLIAVAITLILVQLFRAVFRFLNTYISSKLQETIAYDTRVEMYDHNQKLPYSFHNQADTGDLIQRVTSDIDTSSSFVSNRLPEMINVFVQVLIGAIQVGFINKTIMYISLAMIPIHGLSSIIYFRYSKKLFQKTENLESEVMVIIQENVTNNRVVKAFANEKYEIDKLEKKNKEFKDASIKATDLMSFFWGFTDLFTFLQYSFTMILAIHYAKEGLVSADQIMTMMTVVGMMIWPVRNLGRIVNEFSRTITALDRIAEIKNIRDEFSDNGTLKTEIKGKIEFRNVSFNFNDSNINVLKNVSFTINPGETIALVGKTGSGKTTIVNLLTKLLDIKSGEILIDDRNIDLYDKMYLRKNIGIVMQDPFLYSKTIYENISITNKNITKDKVYEAASIANIHEDINTFDLKYDTIVGEKGATLSGGQKQRVAIARILLEEKPIIVFDDSLSAVDTKTDLMIRQALKQKKNDSTMILITHRITTAKEADKIIVLEDGVITEIGNHEQLSKKEGLYKKLWDIQGSLEKDFVKFLKGDDTNE